MTYDPFVVGSADHLDRQSKALLVLLLTPHILAFLKENDPKALEQGRKAFTFCVHCGQGQPGEKGSEHKSYCPLWISDEQLHDVH